MRVTFSPTFKSQKLRLSENFLTVRGYQGYRLVRGTHGVGYGTWFCEMSFDKDSAPGSHVRLGWVTEDADLDGPVGYDKSGWAYRDIGGTKVTQSFRYSYGEPYKPGDTLGLMIHVAEGDPTDGSFRLVTMVFYKNGVDQGVAFDFEHENIQGKFFPAASLYGDAAVTLNSGPAFAFPPSAPVEAYCDVR